MPSSGTMSPSPWHAGELALQEKVGVTKRMEEFGRRGIRDHLIDQHREFYPQLPFIAIGAVDLDGDVWATLRAGRPGFLHSPDIHTLTVDLDRKPADPADRGMEDGDAVAMLGIEFHTRRRNRLNGTIRRSEPGRFDVVVEQSYGNCPQYIQLRDFSFAREPPLAADHAARHLDRLDARARAMIEAADTFFVASYVEREDGRRQVDVSHRGGKAGFVRIGEDGVLTIPDFAGNLFFNTLGNFLVNPRAGLVFADFEGGDLLQLSGRAQVILDSPEIGAFQGAERLWRFEPRRIIYRPKVLPLRWNFRADGWSPNALMTGNWQDAASRLRASELGRAWRPFRVARIVDESAVIRSFHLEPADGDGLRPHLAGQHLPIRLKPDGGEKTVVRTYTLSLAPSDNAYRISVKREGQVSRHLHDMVKVGDIIEARAPAGAFTIDALEPRPAVLLAGGVGITPLLAMLRHIVYEGLRKRRIRPTWLIYSAHAKANRAFDREIAELVASAKGAVRLLRVLSDPHGAIDGEDYDWVGRIDSALLTSVLPFNDYDFYLCGPPSFAQSLYDGLRGLNVIDGHIHSETFGPASLTRTRDRPGEVKLLPAAAKTSVPVYFARSAKEARWDPGAGSLLELAESRGLSPAFSCRLGNCGTCHTKVIAGAVTYDEVPDAAVEEDEALICCAVPAATPAGPGGRLELDL
ncbi:pyridoxamine 5'-phosphate oxidase family protein [Rhizobium tubonense]|uniref:FAD-binding oxidoreductase n=1 Tax=Rhizobium tubonense TaxID=484088 RepID=A0A2W4END1_9HYPH|nr:pyridoxamine 5'-phosphate oxidase family protein [Rhizobium tubonense]PZM15126.1 FAD-binding oxidoreductase [Rhizobium tubonense]